MHFLRVFAFCLRHGSSTHLIGRDADAGIRTVRRAITLVFTVSLVGCALLGGESQTDVNSIAKKRSSSAMKIVLKDNLIVPGKRIGPVSVGMSVSQLYDVMGEPTHAEKGRGTERYVFEDLEVVVDDGDQSVNSIAIASSEYATADHIKVGLTDLGVRAKLANLSARLLIKEEADTMTYFTAGMAVVVSGGYVKSITVRSASSVPNG